jgi:hypothetical protein
MQLAAFSSTLLLGAALLFVVQPMVAKMVLPRLGGSASVWVTCMLFFQALLLAGYAYAHALRRWLRPRGQIAVHLAMVAAAAWASLPLRVPPGWEEPGDHTPVLWLLALLARTVGPPFLVLASTGPLLQAWFSRTGHPHAGDPYFLYAASNLGSLAGLLAYPLLLEPLLPLARGGLASQSGLWSAGYALCALGLLVTGLLARREAAPGVEPSPTAPAPSLPTGLRWLLLAFLPSSILLGATQSLSSEVAPVPLLWVLPLTAYLLSFVLAFRKRRLVPEWIWRAVLAVAAAGVVAYVWAGTQPPFAWLIALHLTAVFAAGRVLHGRLAEERPASVHLTMFYLWIAAGGVLGGIVNALVAPRLFDTILEYPLALAAACLVARPRGEWRVRALDLVLPAAVAGALAAAQAGLLSFRPQASPLLAVALPLVALGWRPLRLALGLLLVTGLSQVELDRHIDVLLRERTFFGVYRVQALRGSTLPGFDLAGRPVPVEVPPVRVLLHGVTRHGMQFTGEAASRVPTGYYHRSGPVGRVFERLEAAGQVKDVAVVGLGTGTLALYAHPLGRMTFFEIDPAVVRIAREPRLFTYLRDATGPVEVVVADGRLGIAALPDRSLDLLVLDAFSSDAIPVHLLTREALALYQRKLRPSGALAVHVSNQYLDLAPVLASLAGEAHLGGLRCDDHVHGVQQQADRKEPSVWIVLARDPATLRIVQDGEIWEDLARYREDDAAFRWTDDRSDLLRAIDRERD